MQAIAINLFPLSTTEFTIRLHCLPFTEMNRPEHVDEQAVRRYVPLGADSDFYWTFFRQVPDAVPVSLAPFDNIYATLDALRSALLQSCHDNLSPDRFEIKEGIRRRVEFVTDTYPEGSQVISFEPYFLRSRRIFGFLADFRFHPEEQFRGTRRAQELSLSLAKNGQKNLNHYSDRHARLVAFVSTFLPSLLPLHLPGGAQVSITPHLVQLSPERLDVKHYVVGANCEASSQFMGVKGSGPLHPSPQDTLLYFLYRQQDRPLSHDLYRALRGDTFRTFLGMDSMFGLALSGENVTGTSLADFTDAEIRRVRDLVLSKAGGRPVVPIVLTPFSRHDEPEENAPYWSLKHAFLSHGLPVQVVATTTVADKNKLKWSTAGIGLQVFAKAGGTPWKVRPRTQRCLIIGIGQAHRLSDGRIERYFAYSVLTDSSGVFEAVRVLGDSGDEANYLREFSANLKEIVTSYSDRFVNFVVHTTFSIRKRELDSVAEVFSECRGEQKGSPGEFVVLKFNDRNRFFGFAPDHNSRVPYESTVIRLSYKECLIWFEGLQYGHPVIREMIGGPLHVTFAYPAERLSRTQQRAYLQDAINLSGANWRGFNAKSLPVSVYYAQLIAHYLKEFEQHGLPPVEVGVLPPWFL